MNFCNLFITSVFQSPQGLLKFKLTHKINRLKIEVKTGHT